jgi:hypothetical protein
MSRTILQTVMLTATPQHVGRSDTWSRLQAGGALHVVGCWHPVHGAFEISVPATSKANALAVAAGRLKSTGAISCYADISNFC